MSFQEHKENCSGASLERTSKSGIWFTQNNSRTYRNNVAYQQRYFSRSTRHIRPFLSDCRIRNVSDSLVHYSNIIIVISSLGLNICAFAVTFFLVLSKLGKIL